MKPPHDILHDLHAVGMIGAAEGMDPGSLYLSAFRVGMAVGRLTPSAAAALEAELVTWDHSGEDWDARDMLTEVLGRVELAQ